MLTTLAKLKIHLEIPSADLTLDAKLTSFGEAATKAINLYCNQQLEQATVTEYISGNNKVDLILKSKPTTITSIVEDGLAITGFTFNEYYVYKADNVRWFNGIDNIVAVYTAGYTSANVPADLEMAVLLLTEHLFRQNQDRSLSRQSVSKGGESTSYVKDMPLEVKTMLEPYRKVTF
jgi:hypothetical protein